jgi:hypothetical protein
VQEKIGHRSYGSQKAHRLSRAGPIPLLPLASAILNSLLDPAYGGLHRVSARLKRYGLVGWSLAQHG